MRVNQLLRNLIYVGIVDGVLLGLVLIFVLIAIVRWLSNPL